MRISLQFFADLGVNENGDTIIGPPEFIGPPAPPDNSSHGNSFTDFFSWISGVFDELRPKVPFSDILDYNPPSGSVDVNSSVNSASGATEPGKEFDNLDPSAWAQLIEDYFDRVEDYNLAAESRANAFSSAEAQKARDWSERMNSTAYQRTVADLKKAGINPMALFYGKASPVGNFSSSAASATSLSMSQPNFSAASSLSSALISAISGSFKSLLDVLSSLVSRGLKS